MQHPHIPEQTERTFCVRHPEIESNLRCGRCDDLICPRCMVTSPVGARCPSCARIGRPAFLDTSSTELGRAIVSGLGAGVIGALGLALVIRVLVEIPAISSTIGIFIAAAGTVGIGYAVGEAVRYGSGKKVDKRLKYVVAGGVFVGWLATATFLTMLSVSAGFLGSPIGIVGLVASYYVGSYRVRL